MKVDISPWMTQFANLANKTFGSRVRFVGLQGSYARGEATEHSDIDAVLILDVLSLPDLQRYREMLDQMPHRELICGFVSGEKELSRWEPSDLFQFYYDTVPIQGHLEDLLPPIGKEEARRAVWSGACGIYHAVCHNFVHERDAAVLTSLFKSAVFVLQAKYFCETGRYLHRRSDLARALSPDDRQILAGCTDAQTQAGHQDDVFSTLSEKLLRWSGHLIQRFSSSSL